MVGGRMEKTCCYVQTTYGPKHRRDSNLKRRYGNTMWNPARMLFITILILHWLNITTEQLYKLNKGYEKKHNKETYFSRTIWSWYVKQTPIFGSLCDDICTEFGIGKWENYTEERKIISLAKFSTLHQYRNTRAWTGKNTQVPREWKKWRYASSTCDGKFEEGIHQKIKNELKFELKVQNKLRHLGHYPSRY